MTALIVTVLFTFLLNTSSISELSKSKVPVIYQFRMSYGSQDIFLLAYQPNFVLKALIVVHLSREIHNCRESFVRYVSVDIRLRRVE